MQTTSCDNTRDPTRANATLGTVVAPVRGFIAVIQLREVSSLLCGFEQNGRWQIVSSPRRTLRLIGCAGGREVEDDPTEVRRISRLIQRVLVRRAARALTLGSHPGSSPLVGRALARLDEALRSSPAIRRAATAVVHEALRRAIGDRLEAAREARLGALLGQELDDGEFVRRLSALLSDRSVGARNEPVPARPRVAALLLLTPAADPGPAVPPRAPTSALP